jgi:hypothetical protein
VNQLSLQNIRVFAQVRSAHAAGVVTMREASFDQFSALAQKMFPFGALESLAVRWTPRLRQPVKPLFAVR